MATTSKEAVLSALARLLRPLMRVAFEYGITASEISRVVRRTYIDALEAKLNQQNRATTPARLAVVSGLSRSEVAEIRDASRSGAPHSGKPSATLDQIVSLLTAWHTHNKFSGAYGIAMDLDLVPTPGSPRKSFDELVAEVCPGVDQESLLDELVASGSVEIIDGVTVRCLSRAYVPKGADTTRIDRMGRFLEAVAANFAHNLLRSEEAPAYFERAVVADYPLSDKGRDEFLSEAAEKGQAFLVDLDTFLTRLAEREGLQAGKRFGVGVYFFEEQGPPSGASAEVRSFSNRLGTVSKQSPAVQEIDVLAHLRRD